MGDRAESGDWACRGRVLAEHRGMDETTTEEHLRSPLLPRWFWVMVVIIALLWWRGPEIVQAWSGQQAADGVGTFGDQFGAINTLFSGLAFLGVLAGLWIQGREFRHQLKEMQVNAEEMRAQSAIYGEQLKMLQRQNEMLDRQNALMGHQLVNAQVQERLAAQPFLTLKFAADIVEVHVWMQNHGSTVYGVEVTVDGNPDDEGWRQATLSQSPPEQVAHVKFSNAMSRPQLTVNLKYVTRLGHRVVERYTIVPPYRSEVCVAHSDMAGIGRQIREEVERLHAPR